MSQEIDPNVRASWLKLATPEILGVNLIHASLFMVAWEILKNSLIGKPRSFFSSSFRDGEWQVGEAYKREVLSLDKNIFAASCVWFKNMEAITDEDVEKLHAAREYRNQIAHNLLEFLGSFDRDLEGSHLQVVQELLVKIDRWWVINIEIATDLDFVDKEVVEDEVSSGNMLLLAMILDVVSGKQDYLEHLEAMEAKDEK